MPFRDWFVTDRLLEQTVEQQPARTRGPTVEAKHEFVEIALQVLDSDRTLMCAQYSSFQQ
jgi:hypothetical protein